MYETEQFQACIVNNAWILLWAGLSFTYGDILPIPDINTCYLQWISKPMWYGKWCGSVIPFEKVTWELVLLV